MNEKYEQDIPLNWARRAGRPAKPKRVTEVPPRIPRITRLMALAIKFQEMVDRGDVHDYADLARLGLVTRARLTQIMNLLLLAPDLQQQLIDAAASVVNMRETQLRQVLALVLWEDQRLRWARIIVQPQGA